RPRARRPGDGIPRRRSRLSALEPLASRGHHDPSAHGCLLSRSDQWSGLWPGTRTGRCDDWLPTLSPLLLGSISTRGGPARHSDQREEIVRARVAFESPRRTRPSFEYEYEYEYE